MAKKGGKKKGGKGGGKGKKKAGKSENEMTLKEAMLAFQYVTVVIIAFIFKILYIM